MADLYGKMTDTRFDALATNAIVTWWNNQVELVSEFGKISPKEVYTTWKCKAIENFKGLFGVARDGDNLYFEFTYHDKKECCYLDIYKKQEQIVLKVE